jgi:prepilin-type N-terminal cleavage/methylation domain-containing protein
MLTISKKSHEGFTLIEMMIALGIGALVLGAAVELFSKSVSLTWAVSQKSELQQDARAASNLLLKDISLAGAGIPTGGVGLPPKTGTNGTGVTQLFGCAYVGAQCYLGPNNTAAGVYPTQNTGVITPYLYGVTPGCQAGITIAGNLTPTDIITIVYSDNVFPLSDYSTVVINAAGTNAQFTTTNAADAPVNSPTVGLQNGDLVLFQAKLGAGSGATTGYAVAEVTSPLITGAGLGPYTVNFNAGDPLLFNWPTAPSGNLKFLATGTNITATRIWAVTYYLKMTPDPLGVGTGIPTLMRQVNGRTPVPVAENTVNLQFTYDTYDTAGNLVSASCDAGQSIGVTPNQIRTINIAHLTMRNQLSGVKGALGQTTLGYQGVDLQTSISARNLSFSQQY